MIAIILFLSAILRFIKLDQSLWLDEAITAMAVKNYNLWDLLTKYMIGDFHPPLFHTLLWFWAKVFGYSEIALRLPSIIFALVTIYMTYLIGKKMFNKKVGLVAAALFAFSPLHIYYSQEARTYSLATLAVATSFYFFLNLNKNKLWISVGFVISSIMVLYTDYVAYLIFPTQLIYLIGQDKKLIKKYILLMSICLFTMLPWLPTFFKQLKVGLDTASILGNWSSVVGGATLKNLGLFFAKTIIGRISFENKLIYASLVGSVGLVIGILISKNFKIMEKQTKFLFCWFLIPLLAAFSISFIIPVFSYFRMLFILPSFYLLIASGLYKLSDKYSTPTLGFLITASMLFISIFDLNPKFQREDWRKASTVINSLVDYQSIAMFDDNSISAPYQYYSKTLSKALPGLINVPAKNNMDVIDISAKLDKFKRIYLFEYLVDITDPNRLLEKSLIETNFSKTKVYNFNGVGFVNLYEKK